MYTVLNNIIFPFKIVFGLIWINKINVYNINFFNYNKTNYIIFI